MNHACGAYPCPICHPQWPTPSTGPIPQINITPLGCVCPPGSEKTCEGLQCPRKNPFKKVTHDT